METLRKLQLYLACLVILQGLNFLAGSLNAQVLNEHVWLYVDGKYIKTSSYADPPNEIFVAGGISRGINATGSNDDIARWCKNRGCNTVRFCFSTIPANSKNIIFPSIEENIQNYIDPFVQACKRNELYVILEMDAYFHYTKPGDTAIPSGKTWKPSDAQLWAAHWGILAEKYAGEPWVMGYELSDEPYSISAKFLRESYLRCIREIRKTDKRHIIFLGNNDLCHAKYLKNVWGPVNFRPDTPFNQAVFVFHEQPEKYDARKVAPVIDKIQEKYGVPVLCSDLGIEKVKPGFPEDRKKQFEKDMFEMFAPRKAGWILSRLEGCVPNFSAPGYLDTWTAMLSEQASFLPGFNSLAKHPVPARIDCAAAAEIPENENITATAVIKDSNSYILDYANEIVNFSLTARERPVKNIPVKDLRGIAELNMKNDFKKGDRVLIIASTKGIAGNPVEIKITKALKKK